MNTIEQNHIRVMTLNLYAGAFGDYDSVLSQPPHLKDIQTGIKRKNPDIFVGTDSFRWDTLYTTEQLQEMFGFPYAYCINLEDERLKQLGKLQNGIGHNNGITLLSKYEITNAQTIWMETRNALKTTLKIDNQLWDIFGVYLDDVRERTRLEQLRSLLTHVQPGRRTIIAGDFNSISDRDLRFVRRFVDASLRKLPYKTRNKFYSVYEKVAHRGAIKYLESQGFVDVAIKPEKTTPTPLLGRTVPVLNKKIMPTFLRLDYIFLKADEDVQIISTDVPRAQLYANASDHYPFIVDIRVPS